jgi:hypothetical protein
VSLQCRTEITVIVPNICSLHCFLEVQFQQLDSCLRLGAGWLARFGSGMFLILQMIILLDFSQAWNDAWVSEEDDNYLYGLLGLTVCFLIYPLSTIPVFMVAIKSNFDCACDFFIQFYRHVCVMYSSCSIEQCSSTGSGSPGVCDSRTSVAETTALRN